MTRYLPSCVTKYYRQYLSITKIKDRIFVQRTPEKNAFILLKYTETFKTTFLMYDEYVLVKIKIIKIIKLILFTTFYQYVLSCTYISKCFFLLNRVFCLLS